MTSQKETRNQTGDGVGQISVHQRGANRGVGDGRRGRRRITTHGGSVQVNKKRRMEKGNKHSWPKELLNLSFFLL
jgi:hypothetical protein